MKQAGNTGLIEKEGVTVYECKNMQMRVRYGGKRAGIRRNRKNHRAYKDKEGSLIQILHRVQETYGHLPLEVQKFIAPL